MSRGQLTIFIDSERFRFIIAHIPLEQNEYRLYYTGIHRKAPRSFHPSHKENNTLTILERKNNAHTLCTMCLWTKTTPNGSTILRSPNYMPSFTIEL